MNWIFPYLVSGAVTVASLCGLALNTNKGAYRLALLVGVLLGGAVTVVSVYEEGVSVGLWEKLWNSMAGSGVIIPLCAAFAVGGYVRFLFTVGNGKRRTKAEDSRELLDDELV